MNILGRKIGDRLSASGNQKEGAPITHIQWIDVTCNEFYNDRIATFAIINGLKNQTNLIYAGIACMVRGSSEQLVKLLQPKKPPMALNMRNSVLLSETIREKKLVISPALDQLTKMMTNIDYKLTGLSLRQCHLEFNHIMWLERGLRLNKTLIKLDVAKNALRAPTASFLLHALAVNDTLIHVDFSGNLLDDEFGF